MAAVPATAVNSFARMTGIDLGFVPLNRGPEVTGAAQESGARAFTRGGTVHLPGDGEPAQNSETEALLAHELVHVAQQRALGAAATEAGELGEALEAQAAAIERAVRGDGVGVVGVVGADGGVVGDGLSEAMDVPSELMGVDPGALSWTPISGFLPLGDAPAALEPQRAPWVPATPPRSAPPTDHPAAESPSARHVNENPSPGAPGERDTEDAAGATDGGVVAAGLAELSRRVEELARKVGKPVAADADAKIDLDDLAASLCDRVSNRIRADLVVERERAGRLYEFR